MPDALLISLRDPSDAMALHERLCFAEQAALSVEQVHVHSMATGGLPSDAALQDVDAVFFGGSGAYSVLDDIDWIKATLDLLLRVVDMKLPAYASCFGFQGLALAMGGDVRSDDDATEIGSTRLRLTPEGRADSLFSSLPPAFWAQQGHHDRVVRMPSGVVELAVGDVCPEQAFRVEGVPFWASQFHPELTLERTLDRFRHYQDHYLEAEEAERTLLTLLGGEDSPEVGGMLARLVRGHYT